MILSFSLYLGLMAVFWFYAWLGVTLSVGRKEKIVEATSGYFQAIDGLRGVLAFSVFVHHSFCMRNLYVKNSWSADGDVIFAQSAIYAVTLFFFITGFIFWTKLQNDPAPRVGQHLRSRIARLVPAYWACLVLILLYLLIDKKWTIQATSLATVKNTVSWILFTLPGLENTEGGPLISRLFFDVTWTLKLEWIFYLVIPFCGWFAGRPWRAGIFFALLVATHVIVMMVTALYAVPDEVRHLANRTTAVFIYCFSGGILVAAIRPWMVGRFNQSTFRGGVFSLLGIGLLVVGLFFVRPAYGGTESIWLLGPFLLIALGNDWFGLLVSKPIRFLGRISYSVYVIHPILLYLTFRYLNSVYDVSHIPAALYWLVIALLGGVLIVIANYWHRLFEAPYLKSSGAAIHRVID